MCEFVRWFAFPRDLTNTRSDLEGLRWKVVKIEIDVDLFDEGVSWNDDLTRFRLVIRPRVDSHSAPVGEDV